MARKSHESRVSRHVAPHAFLRGVLVRATCELPSAPWTKRPGWGRRAAAHALWSAYARAAPAGDGRRLAVDLGRGHRAGPAEPRRSPGGPAAAGAGPRPVRRHLLSAAAQHQRVG